MTQEIYTTKFYLVLQGRLPTSFRCESDSSENVLNSVFPTKNLSSGFTRLFPRSIEREFDSLTAIPSSEIHLSCKRLFFAFEASRLFAVDGKSDFILALEIAPTDPTIKFEQLDAALNDALANEALRPKVVSTMLPEEYGNVQLALKTAESLSFAVRSYPIFNQGVSTPSAYLALVAYYIYGGMMLSRHEFQLLQLTMDTHQKNSTVGTKGVLNLSVFLSHLDRLFLSQSTSINATVRAFVSNLTLDGRHRDRWDDQQSAVTRLQSIQSLRDRHASLKIQKTMQIILATVSILGLPAAVFFGIFAVTSDADVVRSRGAVLVDQEIVFLFLVILVFCCTILLALGSLAFFATRRRGTK